MKKTLLLISIALTSILSGCSTIGFVAFERLQPGDVSFPETVRQVGIINRIPLLTEQEREAEYASNSLSGDGKTACETLAQGIAETGYFDQVIICDSALWKKSEGADRSLPATVTDSLLQSLGVDMLFSFEELNIRLKENFMFVPEAGVTVPAIDGIVTLTVKVYVPNRRQPLLGVSKADTLCWELTPELEYEQIIKEASEYAATLPIRHLLPHWSQQERCYYDGGNAEMRDAGIYIREQNWDAAAHLWQKVYDSKKGKARMRAAFNLALYYEMQEDFDKAITYLNEADRAAEEGSPDNRMITFYRLQLASQADKNRQLTIQMKRFE